MSLVSLLVLLPRTLVRLTNGPVSAKGGSVSANAARLTCRRQPIQGIARTSQRADCQARYLFLRSVSVYWIQGLELCKEKMNVTVQQELLVIL